MTPGLCKLVLSYIARTQHRRLRVLDASLVSFDSVHSTIFTSTNLNYINGHKIPGGISTWWDWHFTPSMLL